MECGKTTSINTFYALREPLFHGLDEDRWDGFVGGADGDAVHLLNVSPSIKHSKTTCVTYLGIKVRLQP